MATLRIQGWGAGTWKNHTDDADPKLRLLGWGGGRQWRMHCTSSDDARVQGYADGQYKLFCLNLPPPPP